MYPPDALYVFSCPIQLLNTAKLLLNAKKAAFEDGLELAVQFMPFAVQLFVVAAVEFGMVTTDELDAVVVELHVDP